MGNTQAWPLMRTTDVSEAFDLAERLLAVASWYDPTWCNLEAWARSSDVLERLADGFPEARAQPYGEGVGGLPVSLSLRVASVVEARETLTAWADITRCYVLWHNLKWPALPELGWEHEEYKYAELQIACNSGDIHCSEWTAEHTVFVHARPGDEARPAWLAAQVGAGIVGPPEPGW
ncbi:hypothetical protein V2S66_29450 [Streptomyces sp. V4-01]|uniref:Uncharacterized protein n=1 Tax=Actinacidiphila polyblastidii TaxID=3110430 RepID=A0ABU7PJR3_9ACTN|nr:hypothetical protein [Streptomyces sp. V4-01]